MASVKGIFKGIVISSIGFILSGCPQTDLGQSQEKNTTPTITANNNRQPGSTRPTGDPSKIPPPPGAPLVTSPPSPSTTTTPGNTFHISGRVLYERIPISLDKASGAVSLNYAGKITKPARRVTVQAISGNIAVAETITNDVGQYRLEVARGNSAFVRVLAQLVDKKNIKDGFAPDNCNGASWNMPVVDNTNSRAHYVLDNLTVLSDDKDNFDVFAKTTYENGKYTDRSSSPLAILDTIVSVLELVCQYKADIVFPDLLVNWSPNNINVPGSVAEGKISISHFQIDATSDGKAIPSLYLLGKEDVDTDEFDEVVIAHEFSHYLDFSFSRPDSIGGMHSIGDVLDPRVAWGEGLATAIAAMALNNPNYVNTSGSGQGSGFVFSIADQSSGNDRGIFSEYSVGHVLWKIWEATNLFPQQRVFTKIFKTLKESMPKSEAFSTLQMFLALFQKENQGSAEGSALRDVWVSDLDMPLNSLCVGNCKGDGSDIADVFDVDQDIANHICLQCSSPRGYGQNNDGSLAGWPPTFWDLYEPIQSGTLKNNHNLTYFQFAGKGAPNKYGANRYYRLKGSGGTMTVSLKNPIDFSNNSVPCTSDDLDLYIFQKGVLIDSDLLHATTDPNPGCPSLSFNTIRDANYVIVAQGFEKDLRSFEVVVAP